MPDGESDVSFANFGLGDGSKRLYPAPGDPGFPPNKNTPGLSDRGHWEMIERETGLEPATLSLGNRPDPKKERGVTLSALQETA